VAFYGRRLVAASCDKPDNPSAATLHYLYRSTVTAWVLPTPGAKSAVTGYVAGKSALFADQARSSWLQGCIDLRTQLAKLDSPKLDTFSCGEPDNVASFGLTTFLFQSTPTISVVTGSSSTSAVVSTVDAVGAMDVSQDDAIASYEAACATAITTAKAARGTKFLLGVCGKPDNLGGIVRFQYKGKVNILATP
jgi:hypothetical protein